MKPHCISKIIRNQGKKRLINYGKGHNGILIIFCLWTAFCFDESGHDPTEVVKQRWWCEKNVTYRISRGIEAKDPIEKDRSKFGWLEARFFWISDTGIGLWSNISINICLYIYIFVSKSWERTEGIKTWKEERQKELASGTPLGDQRLWLSTLFFMATSRHYRWLLRYRKTWN